MANLYQGADGGQAQLPPPGPAPAPAPTPAPAQQPYYGGSQGGYSSGHANSTPPPPASGPSLTGPLAGLPQERVLQIQDLINQWEQLTGFSVDLGSNQQLIADMAKNYSLSDIFGVAQYLKTQAQTGKLTWGQIGNQPWAWYGMSATEYNTKLSSFASVWSQLTGTTLPANAGQGGLVDQAFMQFQGTMNETQFQQWLLSQDNIKNAYGWLKYGLNFNQFQQQKQGMTIAFGRTLSDQEGVQQLQYLHSATGPVMAIANQPTFTQQEKRQVQVGISGSVAR